MITTERMLKLTEGQGHKVKGQGQICKFIRNLFIDNRRGCNSARPKAPVT